MLTNLLRLEYWRISANDSAVYGGVNYQAKHRLMPSRLRKIFHAKVHEWFSGMKAKQNLVLYVQVDAQQGIHCTRSI